jgi:ATP-dependent Lhr-like helicase
LYRDGVVIGTLVGGVFWFEVSVEALPAERERARGWLARRF